MSRRSHLPLLLVAALAIGACADESVVQPEDAAPDAPVVEASQSVVSGVAGLAVDLPTRHIVQLKGKTTDFENAVADLGGRVVLLHAATGVAVVEGLAEGGAESLAGVKGVSLVAPDPMIPMDEPVTLSAPMTAGSVASPADPSTAYFWPYQWNMRAIDAEAAWDAGRTGSSAVTVAILDTGIGYTHLDLQGLVDLSRSVSFVPIDDAYVNFYFPGAHPVADIGFHGTHVASTVASNGIIAAGVTSGTTLMGVKVCSVVTGGCPGSAIFAGILHAVDNGADVINMSLGGAFLKSANPGYVSVLNNLFNYVKQNDVTVVVSAGNSSVDLDRNLWPIFDEDTDEFLGYQHYPSLFATYCNASHVICVSATGPTSSDNLYVGPFYNIDAPASYTNYGSSAIDVGAPGGNDGGFVWAACSPFSLYGSLAGCAAGTSVVGAAGTSMAAPHVSGLAALGVEDVGKNPSQVRAYVRNSADPIGGGNNAYYGKGRINMATATGN